MKTSSHNRALAVVLKNEPAFRKNEQGFEIANLREKEAREVMVSSLAQAKIWADMLGCTARHVQSWMNGGKITPMQIQKIFDVAPDILDEQKAAIDRGISLAMRYRFGGTQ